MLQTLMFSLRISLLNYAPVFAFNYTLPQLFGRAAPEQGQTRSTSRANIYIQTDARSALA